jgi:hypothetical protein
MAMANTTDFISTVYGELAKLVGASGSSGSSFLLMAWPGYALNPSDFKRSDQPNGPYDPEVAKEALASLANIAPSFDRARFENSGFQIDDLYEILLTSAIPDGATETTVATNPIYRLFSDAAFELMQARRGSHDDPNDFFCPCSASPVQWYDEAAVQGWTAVSLSQTDVKPAEPNSPFAQAGGVALSEKAVWRLRPALADNATWTDKLQDKLTKRAAVAGATGGQLGAQPTKISSKAASLAAQRLASPAVRASATHATLSAAVAAPAARPIATHAALNAAVAPSVTANVMARPAAPAVAARPLAENGSTAKALFQRAGAPSNTLAAKLDLKRVNLTQANLGVASLKQRLVVKSVLGEVLPTKPPAPDTDGFKISFKFCRVNIDRHWLKLALLNTKNWWMFDTPEGQYSTGKSDDNPGMFPLLPTSFIAIRDLRISANWKQDDRNNLKDAASFGFFDLTGATVNENLIEVKGLQIIAWVCNLMPKLPPLSPR